MRVFYSFLAGAVVGGVCGILFAPEKGSVTRERIKKTVDDLSEGITDTVNQARDIVGDYAETGKTKNYK